MKRIYLASQSPARRQLLRQLGVRFTVIRSRAREEMTARRGAYASLVKRNALAKARDAASRLKSGLVIGADTVVVQDGKVYGKPRTLDEARGMLIKLSRKPQVLYTGVAVVDSASRKAYTAYEKTRVYMDRLTLRQVNAYFRRVRPLGMAGGFDIQGKGAFFIRRIEGCFYNVVGLPVRSLYRLLKRAGMSLLAALFAVTVAGCATEYNIATGQEELFYISTEQEVNMGRNIDRQIRQSKEIELVDDPLIQERVKTIGRKIAAVSDRRDISYSFAVIDEEEVNAFALPGGYIYVNKGLLEECKSDDELAGVLAHEIGHVVARHGIKRLQGIQAYSLLRILLVAAPQTNEVGAAADTAFGQLLMGYSREDELLADRLGARYARRAGYDPHAMIDFLRTLREAGRRRPLRPKVYFRTHPYVSDRIRATKQEIGEDIDFTDYINTQEPTDGLR